MRAFKITIAYDGTDFHGWQIQPNDRLTVASCIEATYKSVFNETIKLLGASRTDAGVHALGQVARFKTSRAIEEKTILSAWNNRLPPSILIRDITHVSRRFNPRHFVKQKTYYYHLFYRKPLPFVTRFGWFSKYIDTLDFEKFATALCHFVGAHDFTSFCKIEEGKSPKRKIDAITVEKVEKFGFLRIIIKGQSFARYQIRRMIGAALDIARQKGSYADQIKDLLQHPCEQQAFLRAESCGLLLRKIIYEERR